MNDKDKNVVDKFLDGYEQYSNNQIRYKKIYQRPSKFKALVGFIFSVVMVVLLLFMFVFNLMYFVLLIGVILFGIYCGINLFTKKGLGLPKRIPIYEDEENKND